MVPAPSPPNEAKRIAALLRYDILDTTRDPDFDDFTMVASQICGTPISTISLIDTAREWFKSKVGIEGLELPREKTFCAHAVLSSEFFEVPDALEDQRFWDNPFVIGEPNVRFYAAAPLVTPDGLNIGTLCVVDRTPRSLSAQQRGLLTVLSRQVVHLLELRLANRRIKVLDRNLDDEATTRARGLSPSEQLTRDSFDALTSRIVVLDEKGKVLKTNRAWRDFAKHCQTGIDGLGEGADYLAACDEVSHAGSQEAAMSISIIREMLAGRRNEGSFDYSCEVDQQKLWFFCRFTLLKNEGPLRVMIAHENVTALKVLLWRW